MDYFNKIKKLDWLAKWLFNRGFVKDYLSKSEAYRQLLDADLDKHNQEIVDLGEQITCLYNDITLRDTQISGQEVQISGLESQLLKMNKLNVHLRQRNKLIQKAVVDAKSLVRRVQQEFFVDSETGLKELEELKLYEILCRKHKLDHVHTFLRQLKSEITDTILVAVNEEMKKSRMSYFNGLVHAHTEAYARIPFVMYNVKTDEIYPTKAVYKLLSIAESDTAPKKMNLRKMLRYVDSEYRHYLLDAFVNGGRIRHYPAKTVGSKKENLVLSIKPYYDQNELVAVGLFLKDPKISMRKFSIWQLARKVNFALIQAKEYLPEITLAQLNVNYGFSHSY